MCFPPSLSNPYIWNALLKVAFFLLLPRGLGTKNMQFQAKDKERNEVFLSWRVSLTETPLRLQQFNTTMKTKQRNYNLLNTYYEPKSGWSLSPWLALAAQPHHVPYLLGGPRASDQLSSFLILSKFVFHELRYGFLRSISALNFKAYIQWPEWHLHLDSWQASQN